jgi:hypothetical protein
MKTEDTMKIVKLCLLLLALVVNLKAQDTLQEVVTWQVPEGSIFRLYQLNNDGSDLNNDGYDDFIHWFPEEIYKFQFYLGSSSPNSTFDFEIEVPFGSGGISWGGDLNGDGFKDFVYSVCTNWGDPGDVYICLGGEVINLEPELILHGEDYAPDSYHLGFHGINGGYDFNGDSYDDILTGGIGDDLTWRGMVAIFFGGEEMSTVPDFYYLVMYQII